MPKGQRYFFAYSEQMIRNRLAAITTKLYFWNGAPRRLEEDEIAIADFPRTWGDRQARYGVLLAHKDIILPRARVRERWQAREWDAPEGLWLLRNYDARVPRLGIEKIVPLRARGTDPRAEIEHLRQTHEYLYADHVHKKGLLRGTIDHLALTFYR